MYKVLALMVLCVAVATYGYVAILRQTETTQVSQTLPTSDVNAQNFSSVSDAGSHTRPQTTLTIAGVWEDATDRTHRFSIDPETHQYEETYGGRVVGDGEVALFRGLEQAPSAVATESISENTQYLFLGGISENRLYEVTESDDSSLTLKSKQGASFVLTRASSQR